MLSLLLSTKLLIKVLENNRLAAIESQATLEEIQEFIDTTERQKEKLIISLEDIGHLLLVTYEQFIFLS